MQDYPGADLVLPGPESAVGGWAKCAEPAFTGPGRASRLPGRAGPVMRGAGLRRAGHACGIAARRRGTGPSPTTRRRRLAPRIWPRLSPRSDCCRQPASRTLRPFRRASPRRRPSDASASAAGQPAAASAAGATAEGGGGSRGSDQMRAAAGIRACGRRHGPAAKPAVAAAAGGGGAPAASPPPQARGPVHSRPRETGGLIVRMPSHDSALTARSRPDARPKLPGQGSGGASENGGRGWGGRGGRGCGWGG